MTKKEYKYLPIEDKTPIGPAMAVQQSVMLLDLAGEIATDKQDVDAMLKVSRRWLEFGASVEQVLPEPEEEEESEEEVLKEPFGFQVTNKEVIEKAGEDDGGITANED